MARPLRLEFPGAVYHVIVRGNERKPVFRDDADRRWYLDRLARQGRDLGFSIFAYCLLGNHAHLAVRAGAAPLSRLMARLQSSYTQYFNRRHGRVGHLFQGRYKAFLVEEDPYLLSLIRYIHDNPVKARLVRRPQDYPWSSDRYYRRGGGPEWLDTGLVLAMLGKTRKRASANYAALMSGEGDGEPYDDAPSWAQAVKGSSDFAEETFARLGEPAPRRRELSIASVAAQVSKVEQIEERRLHTVGRGRHEAGARLLVAWVCREAGGLSLASVAKYFGRDASTIVNGVERLEQRMAADRTLRRRAESLAEHFRKASGSDKTKRND